MKSEQFSKDLALSESELAQDWWQPCYRHFFPTMARVIIVVGPSAAQQAGIDKFVVLQSGKRLAVEEKLRPERRPWDILLEYEHVPNDGGKPWAGWIEKDNQYTDYLLVGFPGWNRAFCYPFQILQTTWRRYRSLWIASHGTIKALNGSYTTHSCAVPTSDLSNALTASTSFEF